MNTNYNVVWYWKGGAERGEWKPAYPGVWPDFKTVSALCDDLRRAGYEHHPGTLAIGPPEGPPTS